MAELKTKLTDDSVDTFLNEVEDEQKRTDSFVVKSLMEKLTGEPAKLWGTSIVGFGSYHYKYATGREGDWMLTAFSPRKQNLTLYIMSGFSKYEELLAKLGKHKIGKSCLYIKSLADIDMGVLEELIKASIKHMEPSRNR